MIIRRVVVFHYVGVVYASCDYIGLLLRSHVVHACADIVCVSCLVFKACSDYIKKQGDLVPA